MHIALVAEIVKNARRREAEGDCKATDGFNAEMLELALIALADDVTDLVQCVEAILFHDERGQGVLWSEAMNAAKKKAERLGPFFG